MTPSPRRGEEQSGRLCHWHNLWNAGGIPHRFAGEGERARSASVSAIGVGYPPLRRLPSAMPMEPWRLRPTLSLEGEGFYRSFVA